MLYTLYHKCLRCLLLVLFFKIALPITTNAQQSKLEKLIDKVYNFIEGDSAHPKTKYFVAIPIWGIYPETGIQIGLSNAFFYNAGKDKITRTSLARVNVSLSQYKQYAIKPDINYFSKNNLYNLRLSYNYTYFNEFFYGIGNKSSNTERELYFFKLNQFDLRLTKQFLKNTYIGLQAQAERMSDIDYENKNGLLNSGNIAGGKGSTVAGLGFVVAYDSRDKIFFPLTGTYAEISNALFNKSMGSDFNYNALLIDLRKYYQLKKYNVITFQYYSRLNFGQAPFRQLATIGSDMFMRGYYRGRYRDNLMYAFQAELRQSIWGLLGFAVFAGAGNVGSNTKDLLGSIMPNAGIGIRGVALRKEHFNVRIDYGIGSNGNSGFYFTMGEAF
ncbi:MAG: BamA/TamA family outer membrane protein [Bacteroidia bacterium]